jgi:hypothetical protein
MKLHARSAGVSLRVSVLAAVAAAALALALSGGHGALAGGKHDHAVGGHAHAEPSAAGLNARRLAFHDEMRKLWEDHITWTRLAIVSFAAGQPDFEATAGRLLQNQTDIGDAFKPFYGERAGNRLTALLEEHITGAVALLEAAKSGDTAAFEQAKDAWYRNGEQIARFLSSLNPRNWQLEVVGPMMTTHLDQTLEEAAHRLAGDFSADIRDYEAIHHHILVMADALSDGIMDQFPGRFRRGS